MTRDGAARGAGKSRRGTLPRQQTLNSLDEGGRGLPPRQARPLQLEKLLRHSGSSLTGAIDNYRNKECPPVGHIAGSLDREPPLSSEVTLLAVLCIGRDNRNKQMTVADLLPDLAVPRIPAAQLALIEPNLDTGGAQGLANPLSRLGILRGVAEEYSARRLRQGTYPGSYWLSCRVRSFSKSVIHPVRSMLPPEATRRAATGCDF